jgi:hypothetical protein
MIEFLAVALAVSIVLGMLRCALYELNLYRRQKRDKLIREQVEAARRRRPIPTVPLIDRRGRGRLCAGGAWVDPDEPTVINLHDRRGRR